MTLNGLSQINLELTSRCNKECFFCGHQNKKVNPGLQYGDIEFSLLEAIAAQIPDGIIVQFHRDGEPTIYPMLAQALRLFDRSIRSIVTNGKELVRRSEAIIENCETITVSVFDNDPDGPEQFEIVREFLRIKGGRTPNVNIKIVGSITESLEGELRGLGVPILRRSLHVPHGSYRYRRSDPPIPEVGVCLDFLSHPSVDWMGYMYVCNRLDPAAQGLLGDLRHQTLSQLWNSPKRQEMMRHHIAGKRELANGLCAKCEYWGIATNG